MKLSSLLRPFSPSRIEVVHRRDLRIESASWGAPRNRITLAELDERLGEFFLEVPDDADVQIVWDEEMEPASSDGPSFRITRQWVVFKATWSEWQS